MVATAELSRPAPDPAARADAHLAAASDPQFARDVAEGLSRERKRVPSRWLYDEAGSLLFERITTLPEYYPTRTETSILTAHAGEMLGGAGAGAALVEYGAGASIKTRLLLDACEAPALYVPLDVSDAFDGEIDRALRERHPSLEVRHVAGNFLDAQALPLDGVPGTRVGLFLGSTIGNLEDDEIARFFGHVRDSLGPDARLLIGVDTRKDAATLEAAYDDAAGVTALFDLNLLVRMNRELGADFDVDDFVHEARWNEERSRIEMHLVARRAQSVRIGSADYRFAAGESIRSEISRKFGADDVQVLARDHGWRSAGRWTDPAGLFSVVRLDAI